MKKINRKRNNTVTIRMNDAEYKRFHDKVENSGLTQQSYIINAIDGVPIITKDQISVLADLNRVFADYDRQLRGLATNVNQIAHVANGQGRLPGKNELTDIALQLAEYRKECSDIWQLIRSSISQQKATGR